MIGRGIVLLTLWLLGVSVALAASQRWTLAMNDAELRDVVQQISVILDETVVLDPRVQGRITVLSEQSLDREGVRRLFYSVLDAHGFSAIDEGERLLIIPAAEAKGRASSEGAPVVTWVLELHASAAADLAGLVRPLVSANGYIGPSASANALVVTDTVANVRRIADIIKRLDSGAHQAHEVVTLQHGSASEIARALEPVQGKTGESTGQVLADPRGNRLLVIGSEVNRRRLAALALALDVPATARSDNARVIRLRHGDARQLAELLDDVGQRLGQPGPSVPGANKAQAAALSEVVVKADESQNALILVAEPAHLRTLGRIVEQLDQPRAQVLIQAAIVEVSGDVTQALGVQWGVSRGSVRGGISFPGVGIGLAGLLGGESGALPEGTVLGAGSDRFGLLVSALASDSHNNLLSTPSLLTLDNQQAEILVGQNVPFQTGSYTTSASGADNPFTTVERKDVGISLKIRPHINEGSTLRLEVEQESSEIARSSATDAKDLITNKRALKSTILADDGEIIVIGGLIKDSLRRQQSGVPGLRHLPIVGGLFRWHNEVQEKTNLMVFLRPTIVRGRKAIVQASEQSYERVREDRSNLPATLDTLFEGRTP